MGIVYRMNLTKEGLMKRSAGQEYTDWQMNMFLYLVIIPTGIFALGLITGSIKEVKESVVSHGVLPGVRATQTAEIARAEATSEALAHAAETASAVTDITAVLDEDPTLVGPVEAVALQLHAVSPLTRGLRYRESFKVVVAGRHISIPRGSTVTLRCGDDPTQLLCQVVAVATPTP